MSYYLERIFSFVASIVLLQTLYFKFTAAPESVYIFTELQIEPFGRIGVGIVELFAALLLLFRKTSLFGAILGELVIIAALLLHIFILGIEIMDDNGKLFALAMVVFIACSISIYLQSEKLKIIVNKQKVR